MSLVHNERAKLTATFLNGIALATFAVGSLGPSVATVTGGIPPSRPVLLLAAGCFVLALALHLLARRLLGNLRS